MRATKLIICPLVLAAAIWIPFLSVSNTTQRVTYKDVSDSAGLHFQFHNSPTANKYLIETMGGGVAIFDYDNDGWMDVFFVNGAALKSPQPDNEPPDKGSPEFWNRLYRNNHDGTFTDVTEKAGLQGRGYGMGVAAADYDNDGFTDLYVTNYGGGTLYHNNGDGTFTDVTSKAGLSTRGWTMSAGFLDYDNDGYLDLFVTRYLQWNFTSGSMFCGFNIPGGRAYCHPNKFKGISNYLFHNNHDGTFTDVSESSHIGASAGYGLGVSFGDFNNDGFTDIYVANDSSPQFLFKNNGDGTFTEIGSMAGVAYTEDGNTFSGMGTDFADIDNDGFPDILTTALPYEYFAFFRNNGKGIFDYASVTSGLAQISRPYGGWGIHVFDYDNDGDNEVFVATSHVMDNIEVTQPHLKYLEKPLLLTYHGNKFTDISAESGEVFSQAWAGRGAAFGDLFNHGLVDIVVSDYKYPAHLLRNQGGNGNHWIELDLRGTKSNRDAIGAKVRLTSETGRVQYRTVNTAGSYASSNDRRVLFGIGHESAIREIKIQWPSGIQQVIANPQPDKIFRVVEQAVNSGPAQRPSNHSPDAVRLSGDESSSALEKYNDGLSLAKQGRTPEAVEALEAAIALKPDYVEAHYALGLLFGRLKGDRLTAAVDQFLEVLQLKPDHIDARVNLSEILDKEGDSYAAAAELEKAIRLAPQNSELYVLLGKEQYRSNKYSEAVQSFRKALGLDPQLGAAHYGIGLTLLKQGESPQAIQEFERALRANPEDAYTHYELGKLQLSQGELSQAFQHLQEAVRIQPDLAEAHSELGKLYRRQNKLEDAEKACLTALRFKPDLVEAIYNLAKLLQAQGKQDQAKPYFDKIYQVQTARTATSRANALNADGLKLVDERKLEEALAVFRNALATDPSFFMAAYNQGVVLGKQGKKKESAEAFRTAIRLRPDFVMAHYGLGLVLKTLGDPGANDEIRKAHLLNQYVAQPLGRNLGSTSGEPH